MVDARLVLQGLAQHSREPELGNAILDAAKAGLNLDFLQQTLIQRISEGLALRNGVVARVLASSANEALWELVWPRIDQDTEAILQLFEADYPRTEVEASLCARLFRELEDDSVHPASRMILSALERRGTESSLPTLHSIVSRLKPRAAADRHFAEDLGIVEMMTAAWRMEMMQLAQQTIRAIEERLAASSQGEQMSAEKSQDRDIGERDSKGDDWF